MANEPYLSLNVKEARRQAQSTQARKKAQEDAQGRKNRGETYAFASPGGNKSKTPSNEKKPTSAKKTWKDVKSVSAAKNAGLKHYMGKDGKKKLAITKEELNRKPGETLTQAYNRVEGKTPRKTAAKPSAKPGAKTDAKKTDKKTDKKGRRLILGKDAKIRPFGGAIARALFGKDEDFGKDKGLFDFGPRKKQKKKMGGEVKKYRDGGLSRAQQNLLRSAREHSRNTGQALAPQYRARPKPPPSAPGMRGSGMGPGMKNGGLAKKQGANARLDESLGERRGKESTKSQSMKSRRNESRGARKPSRPQSAGAAKRGWGAAIR